MKLNIKTDVKIFQFSNKLADNWFFVQCQTILLSYDSLFSPFMVHNLINFIYD